MAETILGRKKIQKIATERSLTIKDVSLFSLEFLAYEESLSFSEIGELFKVGKEVVAKIFNKYDLSYDDFMRRSKI